jgi:hypothetical protein
MKTVTKIVFLVCLVAVTCAPVLVWAFTNRDLSGVAGFIAATTGPLGVLTGAMAASSIAKNRTKQP